MKAKQASELGNLQMVVELLTKLNAQQERTNQLLEWVGEMMTHTTPPAPPST